jgi:AcrR family transcriptional regulator
MAADEARQRKPYHSPRRAEQAIATRRAVLDAARELFIERGYAVTTVADIARRARVAVDTVYAAVGRKPALLREVLETAISGSDQAVPAEQRDYVARVRDAKGARKKIETYVAALAEIQPRLAPVYLALRDAAATDPDSAATWREISDRRARNMRAFAADLRATGELRTDLSDEEIADIVWSMNGPEYWTLLVSDRGWSSEQFGHHLTDAWQRLFLADRRSNAVGGVEENLLERAGQVAVPHHGRRGRQRVIFETDQDHVVVDHGPRQPDQPGLAFGHDAGAGQHRGGPVRGRGEGQSHRQ